MKYSIIAFIVLACACVNQETGKNNADTLHPTLVKDTTVPKRQLTTREFAVLLMSDKVKVSDDDGTFGCLDSLLSANPQTREFYTPVARIIMNQSDGALSEAIGMYFKNYLKRFPSEAITFYKSLTKPEQEKFIGFIAFEFYASEEEKKAFTLYEQEAVNNCRNCSQENIDAIKALISQIKIASEEMFKEYDQ